MPNDIVQAPVCAKCSAPIPTQQGTGRRRKYCLVCGPRKRQLAEVQLQLPAFCSEDGCDRAVMARGLCRNHYERQWRARDPERSRTYAREYGQKWRAANPEKHAAIMRRTYAKHRAKNIARAVARNRGIRNSSSETMDYRALLSADPCSYCGTAMTDVDHIDSVNVGGENEWPNLTASCRTCNARKGKRSLLEFLCLTSA